MEAADRALLWLRARDRTQAFQQEHWLYAAALRLTGDVQASELALAPITPNLGKMDAGDVSWLLLSMRAGGFPEDHHLRRRAVAVLVGLQNSDGSFPGEGGAPRDARVTLDAVGAIAPDRAHS